MTATLRRSMSGAAGLSCSPPMNFGDTPLNSSFLRVLIYYVAAIRDMPINPGFPRPADP
jgi:hypothetical protein